jgi:hypothetical protein
MFGWSVMMSAPFANSLPVAVPRCMAQAVHEAFGI